MSDYRAHYSHSVEFYGCKFEEFIRGYIPYGEKYCASDGWGGNNPARDGVGGRSGFFPYGWYLALDNGDNGGVGYARGKAAKREFVDADEAFKSESGMAFPVCSDLRCWNSSSDAPKRFPQ